MCAICQQLSYKQMAVVEVGTREIHKWWARSLNGRLKASGGLGAPGELKAMVLSEVQISL